MLFTKRGKNFLPRACVLVAALGGCTTVPVPLTDADIAVRASREKQLIRQSSPLLAANAQPLDFNTATAHALANNLEIRIAALDSVIARGAVDLADLQKLPTLVRNAGYTFRDPPGASTDRIPGDQVRQTFSSELSWNVLDFGISYMRAKQAANDSLAAEERRRRSANSIVNDVRLAFTQVALGAERLPQVRAMATEMQDAMLRSKTLADARLQDPLVALTYQEGVLDLARLLKSYEGEIAAARGRLARLLNLHPRTPVALASGPDETPLRALRTIDMASLEDVALAQRSELREADYAHRSRKLDIYTAYAQMLPSLRLRWGNLYDSTSSIVDKHWHEEGYSATWNILGIWSSFERAGQAQRTVQSVELRRLALSLSVMEQVDISREQLILLDQDWQFARETTAVRRGIWETRRNRLAFGDNDELERVRAAIALVAAQIREDRAASALQKAYGDMLSAIGVDQFPKGLDLRDPLAASTAIGEHLRTLPAQVAKLAADAAAAEIAAAALPKAGDVPADIKP